MLLATANAAAVAQSAASPSWSVPADGTYVVPEFRFADGESMKNLRLHYVTLGMPHRNKAGHVDNAVLILHGTGGDTNQFLREQFAGVLFVPGGLLDASKYFIVITDGIGHGKSSKPSDGLHARFPHYGYRDMVRAQHDVLVKALHVDHLRLVMGTSMGGMQTWLWGETYPTMMDALMPLASLPVEISGRNRIWRDMIVDDLRNDPGYAGGEYTAQPQGLKAAVDMLWIFGSAPVYNQTQLPTRDAADAYYENTVKKLVSRYDANDMIYQFESSRDYDPEAGLGKIAAPLLAINSADDEINPPELGIVENEIGKVPHGRFVPLPITPQTRGHGTHTLPAIWGSYLAELLRTTSVASQRSPATRRVAVGGDAVSIDVPADWTYKTVSAEEFVTYQFFGPGNGASRLGLSLGAALNGFPRYANGTAYCVNGLRGQTAVEGASRKIMLALPPSQARADLLAFEFPPNDEAAWTAVRSVRIAGYAARC
ncbi:MAG TPA: alpha/beta fold hydrolase [Candidatus Elarobacter sp.]